jgi:threonine/homoserine/homoserine lactone efflux protein
VNFWAFVAIAAPFVLTPGVSTALVLRSAVAGGPRAGVLTALGVNASNATWGILTAVGVAAVLRQWPAAWLAIRIGGVSYLVWLGVRALNHAWRGNFATLDLGASVDPHAAWRYAIDGYITNMLNPAIMTFYLLVVTQFFPRSGPTIAAGLMLSAIHVTMALTVHMTWSIAAGTAAGLLGQKGPRRVLETITGVAMLALAVKAAVSG